MTVFKCKMCGGTLEIKDNSTVVVCDYCGTNQTLPKLYNVTRTGMFDRANDFRRNNQFDKAIAIYEQLLIEDNTDAEAYWSIVLCNYGIKYVEDPKTQKRIPTITRVQVTSILDDENYKSALKYADEKQKPIYMAEAKAINEIQKQFLAISQKEKPFDVFISYKETDSQGNRTLDSVLAQNIYNELIKAGYKVFFSRITLESHVGEEYEPYIFAALNTAKVMVVVGTKPEHFNAVWVKNEWSRYLALMKKDDQKKLIPAFKDMNPYDLPEAFQHLQAQDLSKLGYEQDLVSGIKKIIGSVVAEQTAELSEAQKNAIYAEAIKLMEMDTESAYSRAKELFESISGYKNSNLLCQECVAKLIDFESKKKFFEASELVAEGKYRKAIAVYKQITEQWGIDTSEEIRVCTAKLEQKRKEQSDNFKERVASVIESIKAWNEKRKAPMDENEAQRKYAEAKSLQAVRKYKKAIAIYKQVAVRGGKDTSREIRECQDALGIKEHINRDRRPGCVIIPIIIFVCLIVLLVLSFIDYEILLNGCLTVSLIIGIIVAVLASEIVESLLGRFITFFVAMFIAFALLVALFSFIQGLFGLDTLMDYMSVHSTIAQAYL